MSDIEFSCPDSDQPLLIRPVRELALSSGNAMNLPVTAEHRARVEEFRRKHRTGLLVLLFTDVVDSTRLKQTLGDHAGVALIQQHRALVREILGRFKEGEEIETAGDSFFIVFVKPSDAVRFSLSLQARLGEIARANGHSVRVRIGIHVGEVVIEEHEGRPKAKDLYGTQVDICSRVMTLARADQILLTRSVFDNARLVLKEEAIEGVGQVQWLTYGRYKLKGLDSSVEICGVCEIGRNTDFSLDDPSAVTSLIEPELIGPQSNAPPRTNVEYFCYISRSKVDQLFSTLPAAKLDAPALQSQELGSDGELDQTTVSAMFERGITYGRPGIIQHERTVKLNYVQKLRAVLLAIVAHQSLPQISQAARSNRFASVYYHHQGSFTVAEPIDQLLQPPDPARVITLKTVVQNRTLFLDCSLRFFSEGNESQGQFILHSGNSRFFSGRIALPMETVFVLLDQKHETIVGTPLFLKLASPIGIAL